MVVAGILITVPVLRQMLLSFTIACVDTVFFCFNRLRKISSTLVYGELKKNSSQVGTELN